MFRGQLIRDSRTSRSNLSIKDLSTRTRGSISRPLRRFPYEVDYPRRFLSNYIQGGRRTIFQSAKRVLWDGYLSTYTIQGVRDRELAFITRSIRNDRNPVDPLIPKRRENRRMQYTINPHASRILYPFYISQVLIKYVGAMVGTSKIIIHQDVPTRTRLPFSQGRTKGNESAKDGTIDPYRKEGCNQVRVRIFFRFVRRSLNVIRRRAIPRMNLSIHISVPRRV